MGNVIPQSQVAGENAAARNAALAGCSLSLTASSTYSTWACWPNMGCGTWWVRATGTWTTTIATNGTATTLMIACTPSRNGMDPWIPGASGTSCTAYSYDSWDPGQFIQTNITAVFQDELLSGHTYRGSLIATGADGSVSRATCPNTYTLPGYEPAYMAP